MSDDAEEVTKTIELEVEKSSPQINTNKPRFVSMPIVLNEEKIKYSLKDDDGDKVDVTLYIDGDDEESYSFESSATGKIFKLVAGIHDYRIEAVDMAGNKTRWEQRNVPYWPRAEWTIDVVHPRTDRIETLPPFPPQVNFIPRSDILIRIKSLPEDDYRYLKEVRIKNEANQAERIWRDFEIDDIEFEYEEMPLVPGQVNTIIIKVIPQKGPERIETRRFTLR